MSQANIALNKPAWSSNNSTTNPPRLAVDGEYSTKTDAYGWDGPWFWVADLGDTFTVEKVVLTLVLGKYLVWFDKWVNIHVE